MLKKTLYTRKSISFQADLKCLRLWIEVAEMSQERRIPALDTLRAIAIAWVILRHLIRFFQPGELPRSWWKVLEAGNAGVDLFFVLSGFLITGIILSEIQRTGKLDAVRFWYRRWMRTLPAYYATLGVIYLSDFVVSPDRPWQSVCSYFFFLQNYLTDWQARRFGWSWSLCVEEWFYITLPILIVPLCRLWPGSPKGILRIIALGGLIVSPLSRGLVYWLVDGEDAYWDTYTTTHCRLDGLSAGILIATLPRPKAGLSTTIILTLSLLALAIFVWVDRPSAFDHQKYSALALIFGCIVYASLTENGRFNIRIRGVAFVAEISYALYLVHPILTKAIPRLLPNSGVGVRLGLFALITLIGAVLLRYCVEIPFLALRDYKARKEPVTVHQDKLTQMVTVQRAQS